MNARQPPMSQGPPFMTSARSRTLLAKWCAKARKVEDRNKKRSYTRPGIELGTAEADDR